MRDPSKPGKKKVLIFSEYYLPGYKSGGGMRTIVNIISALHERFDFYVVTSDHDGRSDKTPYKDVKVNEWNLIENAKVFYLSSKDLGYKKVLELIEAVRPEILYSNSYFSIFNIYLLILNRLGKLNGTTYMISPCGELSAGAMKVSLRKKKSFLFLARLLNLHKRAVWKATHETEKGEILEIGVEPDRIHIAPDVTGRLCVEETVHFEKPEKPRGSVKFVFLSRFSEKKNFKYFLDMLRRAKGKIQVDVYGPIDDSQYWKDCEAVISKLPANIVVRPRGSVPHTEVHRILRGYHFFVMPTLGENFGHAFLEALSAGCPLLISDRTPWTGLEEKGVGWDIPLGKDDKWRAVIDRCVGMEEGEYSVWSENARRFAMRWQEKNDYVEITRRLLDEI